MRFSQESCVGGFFQPTFFCAINKEAGLTLGRRTCTGLGRKRHSSAMTWQNVVEGTVRGLGYELVDIEKSAGGLLRVTIDRVPGDPEGEFVVVEDCEKVTRQLQHVLEVENCNYQRLEVSSPGLDRPLKKPADYARFAGAQVALTLKLPFKGRKRFSGTLLARPDGAGWRLRLGDDAPAPKARGTARAAVAAVETPEQVLDFELDEVREARLVPEIDFKGRRFMPAASQDAAQGEGLAVGGDGGR